LKFLKEYNFIEILEGIKVGDEIITDPYQAVSKKLVDGDKIKVVPQNQLFIEEQK